MSEENITGVKKFLKSADNSFQKVADLIDEQSENLTLDTAQDLMDLIYKTSQSIKMLKEGELKKEKEKSENKAGSRVDRKADERRDE